MENEDMTLNYFKTVVSLLLSEKCFNEIFINYNFFDGPCLQLAVSKALGYGIVAGSLMVKVPQILKIWNNQSAEGLSFLSVFSDLVAISVILAYSYVKAFPFFTWGEGFFVNVQTLIIVALVLHFQKSTLVSLIFTSIYAIALYILTNLTPVDVLWTLQTASLPISFSGKLIQAYTNYKNSGTGQLSEVTVFLLLAGCVARIFTSIIETGDKLFIATCIITSVGHGIIMAQIIYYKTYTKDVKKKVL